MTSLISALMACVCSVMILLILSHHNPLSFSICPQTYRSRRTSKFNFKEISPLIGPAFLGG